MFSLARILVGLGLLLVLAGAVVYLLGRFGIPLGHLPGDFAWHRKNVAVYFPLGTSVLLSILLTLVLYLLSRFHK
jgi:NADH:ubiquinone oxidoreductase subunit 6 (subunit J)